LTATYTRQESHTIATAHNWCKTMVSMVPDNPDTLLTRKATAASLIASGYPVAAGTLATMAVRGGGPPYHRFGPRVLYRWGDCLAWAEARLSPAMRSTSEADAA
jgi:hypothetical protein